MGYLDNTGLAYLWGKIKAKLVQPDWQQNDETAPDYVKNRPGGYDKYDVNITWDGVVGDRVTVVGADGSKLVHVSDEILTVDQINGSTLRTSNGREIIISGITDADSVFGEGAATFVSTPGWTFQGDDVQLVFPKAGVYLLSGGPELYIASMTKSTPVKIPRKYLDVNYAFGIAGATVGQIAKIAAVDDSGGPTAWEAVDMKSDNIVLASSTTGSTKKFRIVVDDSGTLSAVEVTDAS